jgi:hypothetical protein
MPVSPPGSRVDWIWCSSARPGGSRDDHPQPASQNVGEGGSATLSETASGSALELPVAFQLPGGATTPTLTLTGVPDAGGNLLGFCRQCGRGVTSSRATLTMLTLARRWMRN